jgi:hypothetical protein
MAKRQSMRGMGADAFFNSPQPAAPDQQAGIPAHQQASVPAAAATDELVKATFYLKPDQVMKLEQLRLARRQRGQKIDKSALVREAIDALAG